MSDLASDTFNPVGQEGQRGPGKWLREAREARRWTQEQAASQLRLPVRVIQGLEQDDYQKLPPSAFVRGYLRNYAKLLNLPEQDIIKQYGDLHSDVQESGFPYSAGPSQVTSSDRRVRWVTYLVLLSVIALPLIWWQAQWSPGVLDDALVRTAPESADGTPVEPMSPEPATTVPSQPDSRSVPQAPMLDPHPPIATALPPTPEAMAPQVTPLLPRPETGLGEDIVAQEVAPAAPVGSDSQQQIATQPPSGDTIVLRFQGESWAQVIDAEGKRLLFDTGSKGSSKTLQGKPPFKLVIGRPSAVRVEYNGQAFDPRSRENQKGIAHFELGSPEQPPKPATDTPASFE